MKGCKPVKAKPCPHCGSEEIFCWDAECGSVSGYRAGCLAVDCDINPFTRTIWPTEEQAIESWNRRAK